METDCSSDIIMETADLSPTEWLEDFIIFSNEELSREFSDDEDLYMHIVCDDDDDDDDDNNVHREVYNENIEEHNSKYDLRMKRMNSLFASQPRLKKICEEWENKFLPSCFTKYKFISDENDSVYELHKKANDLKYLLELSGTNLTSLNVKNYPISQIMPIINANCPNLENLTLAFKEIINEDFENAFSNISNLERLSIEWQSENSPLPMTLVQSLEKIGGTLKRLSLSSTMKENNISSPDLLALVFPQLIALTDLDICNFRLSQLLLRSISEMDNLSVLTLTSRWPKNYRELDTLINMYPIGNLKNLRSILIDCDYGVTDEFLINICNNAKNLTALNILGINITDTGMEALNKLKNLQNFSLLLNNGVKNQFITDKSIQCLFNQELETLNISNCINVSDRSALSLVSNLPNLTDFFLKPLRYSS